MPDEPSWIESAEFEAPWVRVRGRVSRRGAVDWSPCLRTFKGPDGLQHRPRGGKSGKHGAEKHRDARGAESKHEQAALLEQGGQAYWVAFETEAGHRLEIAEVRPGWFSSDQKVAMFTGRLPYHRTTRRVLLGRGDRVLGQFDVPAATPNFDLAQPVQVDEIDTAGIMHLHWVPGAAAKHHPQTYFVRFTSDGRRFYRVGFSLTDTTFDFDLRAMPGGDKCYAQVLATNGYQTAFAATPIFALPAKPPRLLIGPLDGPGLFAQGFSLEHGPLTGELIEWFSDGLAVKTGGSLDARTLGDGRHVVTVQVTAPDGVKVKQDLGLYDGKSGVLAGGIPRL